MKKTRLLIPVILLFIAIFTCCNKTDNSSPIKVYTPEYVTATLSGKITDNDKLPVNGAVVKAGSASVTTGSDGTFLLQNVTIDKHAAFVKVEKEGFFLGTRTVVATEGKNNSVAIELIKKIVAGSINTASGGTVTVPSNGGTISFESNGIINSESKTTYTGSVEVSAFFINPEAENFDAIMPGTLRGINTNNEETGLQSFGMMAVELTGTGGEKLQLAPGKPATLHFPIPEGLQGEAPATIPLWSLDESTGLWKEEGQATRQGKEYVGTVSHFSFWNCDAPFPVIDFKGTITDQQGNKINGVEVVLDAPNGTSTTGSISGNGFTDAEGMIHGKLPANKTIQLKIYNKCKDLLHSQSIGPFATTADLGTIKLNYTTAQVTFSGTVKNCKDEPVANGFVTIMLEDLYYNIPFTNGSFTTTITRCNSNDVTAKITAFDLINQTSGTEVSVPVSGATANAGALSACGISAEMYIKYSIDGVKYELRPPADSLVLYQDIQNSSFMAVVGRRANKEYDEAVIIFKGPKQTGTVGLFITDLWVGDPAVHYTKNTTNGEVNITELGDASGFVAGNYTGTLRDSANTKVVPFTCTFRLKR